MTAGGSTPASWNELLRVAAEDGLSPASTPAYLLVGADGDMAETLARALSPSAHRVGTAANGMAFFAATDALFVTLPLRAAGDREACLPSARWLSTRPDAPLNGIIWLLPAAAALAGRADESAVAPHWKISLAACRRCGVDLPLYALVSAGDGIPGFAAFAASLREEEALEGVIGWAAEEGGEGGVWDDPAPGVEAMEERLRRWRDYRLARTGAGEADMDRDAAFLLPRRAGRAVSRIAEIIADAAPARRGEPGAALRGVYLAALPGAGFPEAPAREGAAEDAAETLMTPPRGNAAPALAPGSAPVRCAFARGVFRSRILPERWLASEPAERERRRSRWTKRLAAVTALLLLAAVAARLTIDWGLRSMTDAPAAVLADVNGYRRWLRGGARGEAPPLAGLDPPPPVVFGGARAVLPELPALYREMLAPCLPMLNSPSWLWRLLFRIGPREASDGAGLAGWLGGPPALALAEEQVAAPLAEALATLRARGGVHDGGALPPEEFNRIHSSGETPVDWRVVEGGAAAEDGIFPDAAEWRDNARALGVWLNRRLSLLSGGNEFPDLPDRFARKRLLDAYRRAEAGAEALYRPWPGDREVAGYFAAARGQSPADAETLWRDMLASGLRGEGDWRREELALVAGWLERPPRAASPAAFAGDWLRAAEAWKDAPGSPLLATARTIWRRAALANLIEWLDALPSGGGDFRAAAAGVSLPPVPLPRIPLCALSQASFDPAREYRPEIWREGMIAHTLSTLASAPQTFADLEAAGLLTPDASARLRWARLEPARAALLAHARAYHDYWVADIAALADPARWIVDAGGADIGGEAFWTEDGDNLAAAARAGYSVPAMSWADFQAAAARVDPRDLTRRMLAELTRRRIDALSAMTEVMAVLEGGDEGLGTRVGYALAALAEDAALFATPEYWQTVQSAWRAWRGLGSNAERALARMRRVLARSDAEDGEGLMETFFPVLAANYHAPESGEAVRLGYWRGFVRTAVELLQAETRRARRLAQRNVLLKADGFPWRRDAGVAGSPASREEMRGLLAGAGIAASAPRPRGAGPPDAGEEDAAPALPDDPELRDAIRELLGGLGLGADWLPPLNRELNARLSRLLSAFDALEAWEDEGGVPLVVLPARLQRDPRHRYLRAFSLRREARAPGAFAGPDRFAPREWDRAYEASLARWAWRIPEQEQMRLSLRGEAIFDFYNQTVPVPEARIGQARLGDGAWPLLWLLVGNGTEARPCPEARVEGAEGARVWQARLPVRGSGGGEPIWWEFGFALPAAFGPETPGGATLLDEWPTASEWRVAVAEWNEFVKQDRALRIATPGDRWMLRSASESWSGSRIAPVPGDAPDPEAECVDCFPSDMLYDEQFN